MGNSISRYYKYYEDEANSGTVLNLDLSGRTDLGIRLENYRKIVLTQDEVDERNEWMQRKNRINRHYLSRLLHKRMTQEDLLTLRVAAPCLHPDPALVSARSPPSDDDRADRHYPQRIEVWNNFRPAVRAFRPDAKGYVVPESVSGVVGSLIAVQKCGTERMEEAFLFDRVLQPLELAGLLGTVQLGSMGAIGDPDFRILEPGTTESKIMGETKTTHNLPLPMKAQEVAKQYNAARTDVDDMPEQEEPGTRPLGWSQVGHPVSQILGYMILNNCRYGVLTCGSRTYFIHIQRRMENNEESVQISDAWFVGEENYLRAWAFLYVSSKSDNQPRLDTGALSKDWLRFTPERAGGKRRAEETAPATTRARSRQKTSRSRSPRPGQASAISRPLSASIPTACLRDFNVGSPIGYGRRGTTFSATWQGETVAVKLFDTHKNDGREAFMREIKAYEHLAEDWGRLVPTPKFTAEAFGVIFFGMQMAEHPPPSARIGDWNGVLRELEEKYGFRHLDVDGDERGPNLQNRMVLRDDDTGRTQPIIIDLEDYEWLPC